MGGQIGLIGLGGKLWCWSIRVRVNWVVNGLGVEGVGQKGSLERK